jgi:CRISPR-associated protein Csd1
MPSRPSTRSKGDNAPVSPPAAFAYTTALNHLLDRNSRQRIQVGDASTVFWAQKDDAEIEEGFAAIFGERDDPDARAEQVRALLGAVQSGQFDGGRGDKLFYVLGLAPNAARVAVRFWHAAPLHEIAHHIRQWFDDLKMIRGGKDQEYPSLFRLLAACAQQGKADNIPPNLGGDIMRAILSGSPFPATWLNAAVLRCRAEQNVTYLRAAGIKASLNRLQRFQPNQSLDKELSDMLDLENNSPAYRLGACSLRWKKSRKKPVPASTRPSANAITAPLPVRRWRFSPPCCVSRITIWRSSRIAAAPSISSVCSVKSWAASTTSRNI